MAVVFICKGLAYSLVPWYGIMSIGELWPPGALTALLTMVDRRVLPLPCSLLYLPSIVTDPYRRLKSYLVELVETCI
jgi:hypothetical protein